MGLVLIMLIIFIEEIISKKEKNSTVNPFCGLLTNPHTTLTVRVNSHVID